MIDAATVEEYMRDANPIPTLDAIDADEFAHFVAATHMKRAAAMHAPTRHPTRSTPSAGQTELGWAGAHVAEREESAMVTHQQPDIETPTPTPTTPPQSRRGPLMAAAVAVVVILAGVGIAFAAGAFESEGDAAAGGEGEPTLTFDGTALTYSGPETLEAGDVTFTLENTSDEVMAFAWVLYNDDSVTLEQERAWFEENPDSATGPPWVETWNRIGEAGPGEVVEETSYLYEGRNGLQAWNPAIGPSSVDVAAVIDVTGN
mgnify:FL=1